MVYELTRTIIQKILQDKILLGLVVICILGIFVGGMTMGDDKGDAHKSKEQQTSDQKTESPAASPAPDPPPEKLTPVLAADFISWWLNGAMDYNPGTAAQSHQQAMSWMTPEAAAAFQSSYWNPQIAQSVIAGQLVAAFQPTAIQAQAINPDGSVVIGVAGTTVVQTGAQPATRAFSASFLVKQEKEGLRVAGLDSHTPAPGSTVY